MKIIQSWDDRCVDDIGLVEILRRHDATASFNQSIVYLVDRCTTRRNLDIREEVLLGSTTWV